MPSMYKCKCHAMRNLEQLSTHRKGKWHAPGKREGALECCGGHDLSWLRLACPLICVRCCALWLAGQVRDDWNKFVPTIAKADELAEAQLGGGGEGGGSSSSSGSQALVPAGRQAAAAAAEGGADAAARDEIGTPVDVRLGE